MNGVANKYQNQMPNFLQILQSNNSEITNTFISNTFNVTYRNFGNSF